LSGKSLDLTLFKYAYAVPHAEKKINAFIPWKCLPHWFFFIFYY